MKIIRRIAKLSSIALAIVMFASYNKSTEGTNAAAPADNAAGNPAAAAVIRYIDGDTLMAKYNLAIDINEAMLRRSNQLDNEQMKRGNEINRLGNEIQNKYKNNGYLTEDINSSKLCCSAVYHFSRKTSGASKPFNCLRLISLSICNGSGLH